MNKLTWTAFFVVGFAVSAQSADHCITVISVHQHWPFHIYYQKGDVKGEQEDQRYKTSSENLINELLTLNTRNIYLKSSSIKEHWALKPSKNAEIIESESGRHVLQISHSDVVLIGGYFRYCHMRALVGAIVGHFQCSDRPFIVHLPAEAIALETKTLAAVIEEAVEPQSNAFAVMNELIERLFSYDDVDNYHSPGIPLGAFIAQDYDFLLSYNGVQAEGPFLRGMRKIVCLKVWNDRNGIDLMMSELARVPTSAD